MRPSPPDARRAAMARCSDGESRRPRRSSRGIRTRRAACSNSASTAALTRSPARRTARSHAPSHARRLEAAWLALEAVVAEEERRWSPELESLERWRPSLWPLLILWTPVAAALVWLGLALGGYVPAPTWLATRLGF